MTQPPARPKIYHITHVENLRDIIAAGGLVSDAEMIARGGPAAAIGMSSIKRRRVEQLELGCHPGTKVGDYVPFYFCPRSIMLFVIYCANHPELTYRGGQGPIQSRIWRRIFTRSSTGPRRVAGVGRSRCPMPGRSTRSSGPGSETWINSTGQRSLPPTFAPRT
jgi:hypothetical protein